MSEENVEQCAGSTTPVRGDHTAVFAAYDPEVEYDFSRSPFGG